jgi:DNA polymerase I
MPKKLFVLDVVLLIYRAHFAMINRPVFIASGLNTAALRIFTQTLLDILQKHQPTHMTAALDGDAALLRQREYPAYKALREPTPQEVAQALPHLQRLLAAWKIPRLTCAGYEADDVIGTLVRRAEPQGFECYMVTPDKDLEQLVSERVFLFKPARAGGTPEVLGVPEVCARWGIQRPEQLTDIIGLWGDASDNIPGVPGIGEKTAGQLIGTYGTIENLLDHLGELKGRVRQNLAANREQALLSKRLATVYCDVPLSVELEGLRLQSPDEQELQRLFDEFEFQALGRRLSGGVRQATGARVAGGSPVPEVHSPTPPNYQAAATSAERSQALQRLRTQPALALAVRAEGEDPREARLLGMAFSCEAGRGDYLPAPDAPSEVATWLDELRPLLEDPRIEKIGHDLKFDLSVLKRHGLTVRGELFDTALAHALIEPDAEHSLPQVSEALLGHKPVPAAQGSDDAAQQAQAATARADLAWQLRPKLEPLLTAQEQDRVFREIESPLLPVLVDMETEGVRVDPAVLTEASEALAHRMAEEEKAIFRVAGKEFNLNAPRELGEILFEVLKIAETPKRTRTGQYATDEQTLAALAPRHEIIRHVLDWRQCSKLKSTYADVLLAMIFARTGRVHTTYHQLDTATGRLNSRNPNLQNIPIRSQLGQEIRKAFVPRDEEYLLLSADYSQIEMRIIAALAPEPHMIQVFESGADVHRATAARVFGVDPERVTPEMRTRAKMVNYGITYGMTAFGLAQRLGISRQEATGIVDNYVAQFPGIRQYTVNTIAFARQHGFVQTLTGRRRHLPDIRSSNDTLRRAAERTAINTPMQGTAADMIKLAMINIHREVDTRGLKTRLLLQVHDELVFDLHRSEEKEVVALVEEKMKTALPLAVPIEVGIGLGRNWLEAH